MYQTYLNLLASSKNYMLNAGALVIVDNVLLKGSVLFHVRIIKFLQIVLNVFAYDVNLRMYMIIVIICLETATIYLQFNNKFEDNM